jgi:endonuclease G
LGKLALHDKRFRFSLPLVGYFVDNYLPPSFYQVQTSDYSGSGYDRGHMCPSADRTNTRTNN